MRLLVERRTSEGLHLDFKRVRAPLGGDDRANVARLVSAFANADGGLIVIGVATGTGAEKEVAAELTPVTRPAERVEEIRAALPDLVSPVPAGVEFRHIGDEAGYVLIHVPASAAPPHMNVNDHRYYQRYGSRTLPLEHYQVADLMGRRNNPLVSCRIDQLAPLRPDEVPPAVADGVRFRVIVRNFGRRAARDVSIFLALPVGDGFAFRAPGWMDVTAANGRAMVTHSDQRLLYQSRPESAFSWDLGPVDAFRPAAVPVELTWGAYADEMEVQSGEVLWGVQGLLTAV
jgi:hypothetical protein